MNTDWQSFLEQQGATLDGNRVMDFGDSNKERQATTIAANHAQAHEAANDLQDDDRHGKGPQGCDGNGDEVINQEELEILSRFWLKP